MRNRKGVTSVEVMFWVVGGIAAAIAYVHTTFTTYREFSQMTPRLDRIEGKLDAALEKK